MATITGIVDCIRIADDVCFVKVIEDGTGDSEYFIVWVSPADPSAFTRVMHSMWLSLLRDSLDSNRNVTVITAGDGATIVDIELHR